MPQTASLLSQFAEKSPGRKKQPKDAVIEMEDPRCNTVAIETEELRCGSSFNSVKIEFEDLRCKGLLNRMAPEIEDPRCNRMTTQMEDPRCKSLF